MYKIVISLSAFIALSNSALNRNPYSHYLSPTEFERLINTNSTDCFNSTDGDNIYRYTVPQLNSSLPNITFSEFKGKVVLIVNVATYCASTFQYPQFNKLIDQFGDALEIIAFPSNNFFNQEPSDSAEEILNGIKYVRPGNGFVPKFKLTQRIDVNGPKAHPIYSYLKRSCPSTRTNFLPDEYLYYDPKNSRDLKWNFEKFLIDPTTGQPVRRYDQMVDPLEIANDIRQLAKL